MDDKTTNDKKSNILLVLDLIFDKKPKFLGRRKKMKYPAFKTLFSLSQFFLIPTQILQVKVFYPKDFF